MYLPEAIVQVEVYLDRMNRRYGSQVFDEWAFIGVTDKRARVLHYRGLRREGLKSTLAQDVQPFLVDFVGGERELGHFDFSRSAEGRVFDAYLVVGEGCYLVCNNTQQSMEGITKDERWLQAQVHFVELSEVFQADPLVWERQASHPA